VSQLGFVLDLDRCTGCAACVIACSTENSPAAGISWRTISTYNRQRLPDAPVLHYSLACNHCLDPACLAGCPAAAYSKDVTTGAVLIDRDRCIGCRYCGWVCPYDTPQFDAAAGVMEKCTFCRHRLEEGLEPACVVACPVEALAFEYVESPPAVARPGFPDTGLRPALRVVGSRRHSPPEMTAAPERGRTAAPQGPAGWRTFRGEWSLWAFSSIITFLVAWFTAATAAGGTVALVPFGAAGSLALLVSALHLGRPIRAWRGVLNWRQSWISREALLVTLFLATAFGLTILEVRSPAAAWTTALVGFAALFAMDMVYRVPGTSVPSVPHSAMATLTGAYYLGLLLTVPAIVLPAAFVKVALYLARRRRFEFGNKILASVRVAVGVALPCTLVFIDGVSPWILVVPAVAGEVIDRARFYAELEFLTPEIQVARDLSTFT